MSAADVTYLDMKYTEDFPLGLTWAGIIDVRSAYEWEPTAVLDVPDAAILGVEAPLWSETTRTLGEVEQLVFPRAAGSGRGRLVAERSARTRMGVLPRARRRPRSAVES